MHKFYVKLVEIQKIKPEQTYKLRLEVLKTCVNYQYKYSGDFDKTTLHFGAFLKGENVGIATLMKNTHIYFEGKQLQLRGMAILAKVQGKSIGQQLITTLKNEAIKQKKDVIWCNARDYSVDFYKKQGFKIIGNKFYIKNVCNHYVMFINLKK